MSNWFKKQAQFDDVDSINDTGEQIVEPQKPVRYRVMIPVDIWATSTGDQFADQENVYNLLKGILDNGASTVEHQGFNDMLQLNDIKTHADVMKEFGL